MKTVDKLKDVLIEITDRSISKCCNGGFYHYGKWTNSNTAYGYKWSYTPL